MPEYSLESHGIKDRELYDAYVEKEFPSMEGKTVAITGTSIHGMGLHLAEVAIRKRAGLILCLNRDSSSAKKGMEGLQAIKEETKSPTEIQCVQCDMQDLEGVKQASAKVNQLCEKDGLDILICNAAIMATKDLRTKDGFEIQMQTNQLSHFLLTNLVWKSIQKAATQRGEARVVTHSSSTRDSLGGNLENQYFEKSAPGTLGSDKAWMILEVLGLSKGPWQRYHQTKLANACFAMELHNRLVSKEITNIKSITADPGIVTSNLQVTSIKEGLMPSWAAKLLAIGSHSAEDGSLSCAMGAFSPDANSGDMYMPAYSIQGKPVKCISGGEPVKKGKEKLTCSKQNQSNSWAFSEEALGIKFEV